MSSTNKKENFYTLLKSNQFVFLDGGMGTMLQARGLKAGETPELLNLTNSDKITEIHSEYINAGAQIIYANTFGANSYKLKESKKNVSEVISAGIINAKKACGDKALCALDIGSIGQLLEPTGTLKFEDAYEIFKEQIIAGKDADLIVFETISDLYEMKAAVLAAKENSDLPIICTMTFEENMRTFTGCSISSMAVTLEGLGVDAIGLNCSLGPKEILPIVKELSEWTNLPIVLKPNAGLPDPDTNEYNCTPKDFANQIFDLIPYGIKIIGGCCGTTPAYIDAVKHKLKGVSHVGILNKIPAVTCTSAKTVVIDRPRVIGERINPTGKKLFKEALKREDIDYILGQAIEQVNAGADILDVNVGLPDIDEKSMMVRTIKALQSITDTPLQIDTTNPDVLEAALRVYNGKAIVNSVNGEDESINSILPIVKKYGAAVVGLTLDKDGIPKSADGRFAIAEKILNNALKIDIRKEDVYIDCLTLTASAEQENVMSTIHALRKVKEELGLKTVLGVSNISFGLPNRELINSQFLQMALTSGLDLPIMNPNTASMMAAIRSYNLLANIDKNAIEFIRAYGSETISTPANTSISDNMDLSYAISNGLKKETAQITERMLKTTDSMEIVDKYLIPALDKAGVDFEIGKIFLPQLIMSASAAQAGFEIIKQNMIKNSQKLISRGKVVLATVKGDVHDIGKNIVKLLMENYGYDVIDLGKDVPPQTIVDAAIKHDVRIVGLSALMTTTLKAMEDTIILLKKNNVNCKIIVGGAVLTADYAKKIGADFYAKDAKESIDCARQIYG